MEDVQFENKIADYLLKSNRNPSIFCEYKKYPFQSIEIID
jgi:hypothetical protein